jgi:perosamine synthetase
MQKINLFGVVNTPEMEAAAIAVLRSGRIGSGEYVAQFEAGISHIVGQPNVVSTVDMTSALFLALHLAGVGTGDQVLTTAFACMSTNSAIAQCGAVPVWVDVQSQSIEIDLQDLTSKIGLKTKAIILYHLAGYPQPVEALARLCNERGIALIEDCDNALFASNNGLHVGSHGDFAVYSFYPTRQINTTEGGALVCKHPEMASRARKLRRFGIDSNTFRTTDGEINPSSDIPEIGWSFTMNNLCAALGCAQLLTAEGRVTKTRSNVALLEKRLTGLHGIQAVPVGAGALPAYWGLLLFANHRDDVLRALKRKGVMASTMHMRNDLYSGFHANGGDSLQNTMYLQDHILGLPCGWWLTDSDLEAISFAVEHAVTAPTPN